MKKMTDSLFWQIAKQILRTSLIGFLVGMIWTLLYWSLLLLVIGFIQSDIAVDLATFLNAMWIYLFFCTILGFPFMGGLAFAQIAFMLGAVSASLAFLTRNKRLIIFVCGALIFLETLPVLVAVPFVMQESFLASFFVFFIPWATICITTTILTRNCYQRVVKAIDSQKSMEGNLSKENVATVTGKS